MTDVGSNNCVPIPNFHGYYLLRNGTVISTRRGKAKILNQQVNASGYYVVTIYRDVKRYSKLVHRLVAVAYLPDYSEELQVDHIDGNRKNNNLNNLRMVTCRDNSRNRHDYLCGIEFAMKYVVCHWSDDRNKLHTIYFSINRYGFAFAFLMATNLREEMVKLYYNRVE